MCEVRNADGNGIILIVVLYGLFYLEEEMEHVRDLFLVCTP